MPARSTWHMAPGPTAQRAMFADFATPLFHDTYAILARKGFAPKSWTQLNLPESLVAVDERLGTRRGRPAVCRQCRDHRVQDPRGGAARRPIGSCRLLCCNCAFALALLKKNPEIGELVVPTPQFGALPYARQCRMTTTAGSAAWSTRGAKIIAELVRSEVGFMAGLADFGIAPGDVPPDASI